jgi:U3 small nucleolar RNA-associated protein 15
VKKTVSRFKSVAYSADFRYDGRVLAAGTEEGAVQVFDLSSRAILRSLKGHTAPSRCVRFAAASPNIIFSGSDDKTAARWDMSTQKLLERLRGHTDYVRAITDEHLAESHFSAASITAAVPAATDASADAAASASGSSGMETAPLDGGHRVVITGSYDHSIRLWDVRASSTAAQLTIDYGYPVECVLVTRSASLLFAAGDMFIKVFNLLKGGECVATLSNHTKTVTALALDGSGTRLLSAGLDQFVKFYNMEDYTVTHSIKYDGPILSAAVSVSCDTRTRSNRCVHGTRAPSARIAQCCRLAAIAVQ